MMIFFTILKSKQQQPQQLVDEEGGIHQHSRVSHEMSLRLFVVDQTVLFLIQKRMLEKRIILN